MKKIFVLAALFIFLVASSGWMLAQEVDISGTWEGETNVPV